MSRKEPENLQEVLQVLARKLPAFDADDDEEDGGTLSIDICRSFYWMHCEKVTKRSSILQRT